MTIPNSAILAAFAFAFGTKDIACQCEFRCLAFVELFEGYVDTMDKVFGLARALRPSAAATTERTSAATTSAEEAAAPAAEKLAEQILHKQLREQCRKDGTK